MCVFKSQLRVYVLLYIKYQQAGYKRSVVCLQIPYISDFLCMMIYLCTYYCADGVPNDGIPTEEVVTVSLGLTVVYVFLATAGIVFAVVCLAFTVIFRTKRLVAVKILCLGWHLYQRVLYDFTLYIDLVMVIQNIHYV